MRVRLSSEVLDGRHDPLLVLFFFAMGASGRHRVLCSRTDLKPWLAELPEDLRAEVEMALELSEAEEALGPDVETVRIVANQGSFTGNPVTLSPTQAASVLTRPLQVVVENGDNDRAFLLAFADSATRKTLEDAERDGWLEFWNGGGIDGCKGRAAQLATPNAATVRTLVYSDSDAREPGVPSEKAKQVKSALQAATTAHGWKTHRLGRVLKRRASENYVPAAAFATWWRKAQKFHEAEASNWLSSKDRDEVRALDRQDSRRVWVCAKVLEDASDDVREHYDVDWGRARAQQVNLTNHPNPAQPTRFGRP